MKELKGRTAILTGASRGLGMHIARALSREGVDLALVARTREAIEQLSSELSETGVRAIAIEADLLNLDCIDELIDRAETALGAIDILINNAAIDGVYPFPSESDLQTEQIIKLDLICPIMLARKCLQKMLPRKTGHIINISSLAGKIATPYNVTYSAAKGGLITFTHGLRAEIQGSGVNVSVLCPGFVTDQGMFAKRQEIHGTRVSFLVGTSLPEQVAQAVIDVLRNKKAEVVVNPGPVRLLHAFTQLAPGSVPWVQKRLGISGMIRTFALSDKGKSSPNDDT